MARSGEVIKTGAKNAGKITSHDATFHGRTRNVMSHIPPKKGSCPKSNTIAGKGDPGRENDSGEKDRGPHKGTEGWNMKQDASFIHLP